MKYKDYNTVVKLAKMRQGQLHVKAVTFAAEASLVIMVDKSQPDISYFPYHSLERNVKRLVMNYLVAAFMYTTQ